MRTCKRKAKCNRTVYSIMEQYGRLRKCNYQIVTQHLKKQNLIKAETSEIKFNKTKCVHANNVIFFMREKCTSRTKQASRIYYIVVLF